MAHTSRGALALALGRHADALAAFTAADQLAGHLAASHVIAPPTRALRLPTLVRLGDLEGAGHYLAELGEQDRDCGEMRIATAGLRLAQQHPDSALAALAPILDGSSALNWLPWLIGAFVLEAIARDTLADPAAADHAMKRALDLAEPDRERFFFLIQPAPRLLERQADNHAYPPYSDKFSGSWLGSRGRMSFGYRRH